MTYDEALREAQKCREALAAVLVPTSHRKPPPDAESVVLCKEKVRRGIANNLCDGDCPWR